MTWATRFWVGQHTQIRVARTLFLAHPHLVHHFSALAQPLLSVLTGSPTESTRFLACFDKRAHLRAKQRHHPLQDRRESVAAYHSTDR